MGSGAGAAALRPAAPGALALAGLALFGYLFNWLVVERVQRWTGQYVNRHTLAAGGLAAGALAIGLGMRRVIGGLASLALARAPRRARLPRLRRLPRRLDR